jgi:hypothetical protein
MLEYCDYIAHLVHKALAAASSSDTASIIRKVDGPQLDLHATDGWLQSTDKTIIVEDSNGTFYQVTVQALGK